VQRTETPEIDSSPVFARPNAQACERFALLLDLGSERNAEHPGVVLGEKRVVMARDGVDHS